MRKPIYNISAINIESFARERIGHIGHIEKHWHIKKKNENNKIYQHIYNNIIYNM